MHLDGTLDHAESYAEAAFRAIQGAVALYEEIEYPRQKLRYDADTGVGDLDDSTSCHQTGLNANLAGAGSLGANLIGDCHAHVLIERNPIFACVPSQKGLLPLPPQRHKRA